MDVGDHLPGRRLSIPRAHAPALNGSPGVNLRKRIRKPYRAVAERPSAEPPSSAPCGLAIVTEPPHARRQAPPHTSNIPLASIIAQPTTM